MAYSLLGKNFTPPDVVAKVTGKAKYAEDFRAQGMVFCKLYRSPMPHARVKKIDASAALKMKGVVGILTAKDVPAMPPPVNPILTNEPHYVGEPIFAVAAETEALCAEALDKIKVDLEPLPFVTNPLDSLYPGGPDARTGGNVANVRLKMQKVKWSAGDFAKVKEGDLPKGKPAEQWTYGDIDKGFKAAKVVLEESFVTAGYSHHAMEPRSAMAFWENGKCHVHGSSQSQAFTVPGLAKLVGVKPHQIVYTGEYCGGGFGGKAYSYPIMSIPAHMSKKIKRPVMLRITRAEEYAAVARPGFQGSIKIGFKADGRVSAVDLYVVHENGPNMGFWDFRNAGNAVALVFQPENMRWRGISVLTNTPLRGAQRGPGENQMAAAIEPIIDKAARKLGIDRVAIRRINAPDNNAKYGAKRKPVSSAYLKDALDKGAKRFNWDEKKKLSGKRNGTKVIGVGVGSAYHTAGFNGFDGLVRITTDGKLHIHTGVGNLGTYSYAATSRVAAEVLGYDWKNCIIERGDSRRHLPWNIGQFGSNTSFTMSRTNYVAAMDAKNKLLEIAAKDLGGKPDDYELKNERVVAKSGGKSMTFAEAAKRAVEMGGKFTGKELPENINPMTKASATALSGSGLIGVAKDTLKRTGVTPALSASFVQIELDTETGQFEVQDYVCAADCGTVIHPQSLATQISGAAAMGFGMASLERHVYDPKNGIPANIGFHESKPATYLDMPSIGEMKWEAVNKPDPSNPLGIKGIGEPIMGSAAAALLSAISDALGGHMFNRTPVVADMIVNAAAGRPQSHKPLQVNTQ